MCFGSTLRISYSKIVSLKERQHFYFKNHCEHFFYNHRTTVPCYENGLSFDREVTPKDTFTNSNYCILKTTG